MEIFVKALKFIFDGAFVFFLLSALTVFLYCFYDRGFQWNKKKALFFAGIGILDASIAVFTPWVVYTALAPFTIALACFAVLYDYKGKKIIGLLKFYPAYFAISSATSALSLIGSGLLLEDSVLNISQMHAILEEYYATAEVISYKEILSVFNDTMFSISNGEFLFISILSAAVFALVFFFIYHKLYKRDITLKGKVQDIILAAVYPEVCMILCTLLLTFGSESRVTTIILTFLSIFFGLMFPVFIYFSRIGQHYRDRAIYQENHMQAELSHFEQYKQNQEETTRFRHDIRNNLLCLNNMLQEGRTQEATEYLNDLLHTSRSLSPKFVSGDQMLDCILGVKDRVMEENGIAFQLDGVMAGGLGWKPMDVCNVFANALDNAIESCQQMPAEERFINMSIRSTEQYWFISIENPVLKDVDIQQLFLKDGGYTSKSDTGQHGIGTYNMKQTVEHYGGILKATCENHRFTLEIMIDNTTTE